MPRFLRNGALGTMRAKLRNDASLASGSLENNRSFPCPANARRNMVARKSSCCMISAHVLMPASAPNSSALLSLVPRRKWDNGRSQSFSAGRIVVRRVYRTRKTPARFAVLQMVVTGRKHGVQQSCLRWRRVRDGTTLCRVDRVASHRQRRQRRVNSVRRKRVCREKAVG